jgi:hypothetical protein
VHGKIAELSPYNFTYKEYFSMKVIKYGRWLLALAILSVGAVSHAHVVPSRLFNASAPGVVAPSIPQFYDEDGKIVMTKSGSGANTYWTMTGTGSDTALMKSRSNGYELGRDSFKYVANFNSDGQLITTKPGTTTTLTNFLEIKGSLPAGNIGGTSWSAVPNQLLLKATLLDVNVANGTPDRIATLGNSSSFSALGFTTIWDTSTPGWAVTTPGLTGGSTGESLWLGGLGNSDFYNLVKALDSNTGNGTLSSLFSSRKTIGDVYAVASVPVPAAAWLFGSGLMALFAGHRKRAA